MKKSTRSLFLMMVFIFTFAFMASCNATTNSKDKETATQETTTQEETTAKEAASGKTTYPLTITDDLNNEVTIEKEPEKVVSLSPQNTETIFAVGAGDKVVGRTDYCNYPKEVSDIQSIGSYSEPNVELIVSLSPDVVFASDYIDDSVRQQIEQTGAKVIVFSANSVDTVKNAITVTGEVLNESETAKKVTDEMTSELKELQAEIAKNKKEVSAFIDLGSYYSAGKDSLLDNMLKDISVKNVAESTGEQWPQLSVEKIIEDNPDVYISFYTTPEELKKVSGLSDLDCIKNDKIIYYEANSDDADLIQRAGPRMVEGEKTLAKSIYGN